MAGNICKKKPVSVLLVLADSEQVYLNSTVSHRIARMNEVYKKDINQPFAIQYSSIHKSAFDGNLSGVQYFLRKKGKDAVYVDTFDMRGCAASHIACERGHDHVIQYLLNNAYNQANPNLKSTIDGSTPLMIASREGHLACVEILLGHGAKPFEKNRSGMTAVHLASQSDHLECVKAIFLNTERAKLQLEEEERKAKAAVDALHLSIQEYVPTEKRPQRREMWCHVRAAESVKPRLLVPENLMDDEAARKLKKELAEQIERQKQLAELTDPNNSLLEMKCNNGMSPLHIACQFNAENTALWLLQSDVELNSTDKISGDTPLHKAARVKSFGIYKALVKAGCDERKKNFLNETPRQLMYDANT